jgi:hypothetical protein
VYTVNRVLIFLKLDRCSDVDHLSIGRENIFINMWESFLMTLISMTYYEVAFLREIDRIQLNNEQNGDD